jgi:hypothetical protein
MELVTRYTVGAHHGWYVGSKPQVVLAPLEQQTWPGVFEAFRRMRGYGAEEFQFESVGDEADFFREVHVTRAGTLEVGEPGGGGSR